MKRSNVTIICQDMAYAKFAEAWQGKDCVPSIKTGSIDEEVYYILEWSDVVWNQWNPQVEGVLKALESIDGNGLDGFAFRCVEITEENEIFWTISDPDAVFYDFCVSIEVQWPYKTNESSDENSKSALAAKEKQKVLTVVDEALEKYDADVLSVDRNGDMIDVNICTSRASDYYMLSVARYNKCNIKSLEKELDKRSVGHCW